jgi:hypothetical protein
MRIVCQLLAISVLYLMPLNSAAQDHDVVPYPKPVLKVDWVRGTDFSKYKTYAWGSSRQTTADPKHTIEGMIDAALQAKGLQKVGTDENPNLVVVLNAGNKLIYTLQSYNLVKEGTLVIQLADPQLKEAVWWGIAEDTLTDKPEKDRNLIQKKISKMFQEYPPPAKE